MNIGITEAINSLINKLNKAERVNFRFQSTGSEVYLGETLFISLYRILSELINNTLKHSGASNINITLEFVQNHVKLVFADDGKGFDLDKALSVNAGIGLKSVMNRVALCDGEYRFESKDTEGVLFEFSFVLPDAINY